MLLYCNFCEENTSPKYSQEQIIIGLMLFIIFCVLGLLYFYFAQKNTCSICDDLIIINSNTTTKDYSSND